MIRDITALNFLEELYTNDCVVDEPRVGPRKIDRTYLVQKDKKYSIAAQFMSHHSPALTKNGYQLNFIGNNRSIIMNLVYYPNNLEHAEKFSRTKTWPEGPQEAAPGSVAVLQFVSNPTKSASAIHYLQYSFRSGSPEDLSRSITTKYMGARTRLLNAFFNLDCVLISDSINLKGLSKGQGNEKALENVLEKNEKIKNYFIRFDYELLAKKFSTDCPEEPLRQIS